MKPSRYQRVSFTNAHIEKKLCNYLRSSVHSLLAKLNSIYNSRRQLCNSGIAHQYAHPHKPASM